MKYTRQWKVPSNSGGRDYTVSLKEDGTFVCSCPHSIFRKLECRHIKAVKAGAYDNDDSESEPRHDFGQVREVTVRPDGTVIVPLVPLGDTHFAATIVYDLLHNGFSFRSDVVKRYGFKAHQKNDIEQYIKRKGRKIYGKFIEGQGFVGFETVK